VRTLFSFPNPVNEKAARFVAGVVLATVHRSPRDGLVLAADPLAYGFWARR